jgi:hypothetical protein
LLSAQAGQRLATAEPRKTNKKRRGLKGSILPLLMTSDRPVSKNGKNNLFWIGHSFRFQD